MVGVLGSATLASSLTGTQRRVACLSPRYAALAQRNRLTGVVGSSRQGRDRVETGRRTPLDPNMLIGDDDDPSSLIHGVLLHHQRAQFDIERLCSPQIHDLQQVVN